MFSNIYISAFHNQDKLVTASLSTETSNEQGEHWVTCWTAIPL
jgi:hypothetical protein